jgi:hypothetical protein
MLKEDLQDAAQILRNILTTSLKVKGIDQGISLLQAAEEYTKDSYDTSDLKKILQSFLEYPNPTKTLVTELELLIQDLG